MSDKPRFPLAVAITVYNELLDGLEPWCERIAMAGSARRERKDVGDLEILFVPKMSKAKTGFFAEDNEPVDCAALKIGEFLTFGTIAQRPNKNGSVSWGPKNKLAIHVKTGMPVDFFTEPDIRCWFRSLVIRTGGAHTNVSLTTGAQKRNRILHAYGDKCLEDLSTGEITYPDSEFDVFNFCGATEYLEPWQRM